MEERFGLGWRVSRAIALLVRLTVLLMSRYQLSPWNRSFDEYSVKFLKVGLSHLICNYFLFPRREQKAP